MGQLAESARWDLGPLAGSAAASWVTRWSSARGEGAGWSARYPRAADLSLLTLGPALLTLWSTKDKTHTVGVPASTMARM